MNMKASSTIGTLLVFQIGLLASPLWWPAQEPIPFDQLPAEPLGTPLTLFEEWYEKNTFLGPGRVWTPENDLWRDINRNGDYGESNFQITHKGAQAIAWEACAELMEGAGSGSAEIGAWIEQFKTPEGIAHVVDELRSLSVNGTIEPVVVYDWLKLRLPNHIPDMDRQQMIQAAKDAWLREWEANRQSWLERDIHPETYPYERHTERRDY